MSVWNFSVVTNTKITHLKLAGYKVLYLDILCSFFVVQIFILLVGIFLFVLLF